MTLAARMVAWAFIVGCSRSPEPAPLAAAPSSVPAPPAGGGASAAAELDRMDRRSPVPLLPAMAAHQKQNMRDHLVAVQDVVSALSTADFAGVEAAAARIGFSQMMGQTCTHLGSGAPGFADQAIEFHHTADRIAGAARDRDGSGVLMALGATLRACTSCHAVWKQQVVDEPTWQRLASSLPAVMERPSH